MCDICMWKCCPCDLEMGNVQVMKHVVAVECGCALEVVGTAAGIGEVHEVLSCSGDGAATVSAC
jgi:hypothetical protein